MPLVHITTPVAVPPERQESLLRSLSQTLAELTGKPEKYVMIVLTHGNIMFSETTGPSAFVDVRGVGPFTQTVNSKISRRISDLLKRDLGIPAERIYLNFTSFQPSHWGWNGETF